MAAMNVWHLAPTSGTFEAESEMEKLRLSHKVSFDFYNLTRDKLASAFIKLEAEH